MIGRTGGTRPPRPGTAVTIYINHIYEFFKCPRGPEDGLRGEFDPEAGAGVMGRQDGAVTFGPLLCRAAFRSAGARAYDPVSTLVKGWKVEPAEIATPAGSGPGFCAVLDNAP